jgi:hypothetical protein
MPFNPKEASELLVACHRRCCICHRYCGVKIELDHICPRADEGGDEVDNAIPVCFECHAEIHLYNDRHPRSRKFRPDELKAHKEQWLRICREFPNALLDAPRPQEVGPIQSLIDELIFNSELANRTDDETIGALFLVSQFTRSIEQGIFSLLPDSVRGQLRTTYATLMQANMYLQKMATVPWGGSGSAWHHAYSFASKAITRAQSEVPAALKELLSYLGHDKEAA